MEFDNMISSLNDSELSQLQKALSDKLSRRVKIYGDEALGQMLGCTEQTVGKYRRAGWFPAYRIGRKNFYYLDEVEAALKLRKHDRFGELRGKK